MVLGMHMILHYTKLILVASLIIYLAAIKVWINNYIPQFTVGCDHFSDQNFISNLAGPPWWTLGISMNE